MRIGLFFLLIFANTCFLAAYGNGGSSGNSSGVYGTVASIFLFQGAYSVGVTPLTILYPPEVLNYSIRSNGMAAWTLIINLAGYVFNLYSCHRLAQNLPVHIFPPS